MLAGAAEAITVAVLGHSGVRFWGVTAFAAPVLAFGRLVIERSWLSKLLARASAVTEGTAIGPRPLLRAVTLRVAFLGVSNAFAAVLGGAHDFHNFAGLIAAESTGLAVSSVARAAMVRSWVRQSQGELLVSVGRLGPNFEYFVANR